MAPFPQHRQHDHVAGSAAAGSSRARLLPVLRTGEAEIAKPDDEEKRHESERQAWFDNEVKKRLNLPSGYLKVAVLAIRWDDNIDGFKAGHDNELAQLRQLFRHDFGFIFEEVKLSTAKKPQNALNYAIAQHIHKYDDPHNLLIIYYTGHGILRDPSGDERLELSATGREALSIATERYTATAYWDEAERPLLKSADADVLAILDCCYASNAHKGITGSRRIYELIAACSRGDTTPVPGPNSFTSRLIASLRELLGQHDDAGFTTMKLLDNINRKISKGNAQLHDRLHKFECRHVQLARCDDKAVEEKKTKIKSQPAEGAWLKVRFSLAKYDLTRNQTVDLAHQLCLAFTNAHVPLSRIDWVKFSRPVPVLPLSQINKAIIMLEKWKRRWKCRRALQQPAFNLMAPKLFSQALRLAPSQRPTQQPEPSFPSSDTDPLLGFKQPPSRMGRVDHLWQCQDSILGCLKQLYAFIFNLWKRPRTTRENAMSV